MESVKVKKIEIINFKGIDHLELDFTYENSDNILDDIVFYGINGSGKSTILEALYFGLLITSASPNPELCKAIETLLIKDFALGKDWIYNNEKNFQIILTLVDNGNTIITKLIYNKSKGINWSSNEDKITFNINRTPYTYLSAYRLFMPKKVENAGDWKEIKKIKNKKNYVENHSLSMQFHNGYDTTKQYLVNLVTDKKVGVISDTNIEVLEKIKEAFKIFFPNKVFLEELARNEEVQDYKFLIKNEDQTIVDIDQLSSGEREIIAFFTYLATEAINKSILIIDEPELHLHAKWQSILVYAIHKLFPNTQLFLATHSSEIHQSVSESELFELVK